MEERNSPVVFQRLHSIEVSEAGMIVVADCMHVSGAIRGSAPNEERNPRSSSEPEAEQPASSSSGKKLP